MPLALDTSPVANARWVRHAEPDGSIALSWVEGWVPADTECWRLGRGELASVGELWWSYHDSVAGSAPETGFAEGP